MNLKKMEEEGFSDGTHNHVNWDASEQVLHSTQMTLAHKTSFGNVWSQEDDEDLGTQGLRHMPLLWQKGNRSSYPLLSR